MRWALVLVALAACDDGRPGALDDCGGDLRGVWHDDAGRRFDVIGSADGWEWYPMYDDRPEVPDGVVAAPGMIEMPRVHGDLAGTFTRRYERATAICPVKTAARLHDCHGDRAQLDVRPPPLPSFPDCIAPEAAPETWLLVRE